MVKFISGKTALSKSTNLLYNKGVLYTVFVIAFVNFLSYLMIGDIRHSIIFVLTGYVVSLLNKNMVVILCIAMAVTNIVKVTGTHGTWKREGMKSDKSNKDKQEEEEEENETEESTDTGDDNMDVIRKDGAELIKMQDKIIDGFNEIQPYMDKAEKLARKIDNTATKLLDAQ